MAAGEDDAGLGREPRLQQVIDEGAQIVAQNQENREQDNGK